MRAFCQVFCELWEVAGEWFRITPRQFAVAILAFWLFGFFTGWGLRGCGHHEPAKPAEVAKAAVVPAPTKQLQESPFPAVPAEALPPRIIPELSKNGMPSMPLLPTAEGSLTGIIVIVDPGHGGKDPGCHWPVEWVENGQNKSITAYEAAVTYPAAWQLAETLVARGAVVFLTAWDPNMRERDTGARDLLLPRAARYLDTEKWVDADTIFMRRGMIFVALKFAKTHGLRRVAWVSVHVDSVPGVTGAHVCCWPKATFLGAPIAAELEAAGLATPGKALWEKTDRLGILSPSRNSLKRRALVEFGVPGNDPGDSWRLRDADSRQQLLDCVVRGLEQVNTP